MKIWGVVMLTIGVTIALASLLMTTTVSTTAGSYLTGTTSSEIYNMGLIQRQLMVFLAGLALAVGGVAVAAAGAVIDALQVGAPGEVTPSAAMTSGPAPGERAEDSAPVGEPNIDSFFIAAGLAVVTVVVIIIIALAVHPDAEPPAAAVASNAMNVSEEVTMTDNANGQH